MNRRDMLKTSAAALVLGASPFPLGWTARAESAKKRILMFTRSQGFEHPVVKRGKNNELSLAENIVTELANKHNFEVECTKDGRVFLPETIKKYDAFLFETTGDLTVEKSTDNTPPMPPEGKEALLKAIAEGKGFVGCHCASDTFHSPGERRQNQEAEKIDPYIAMLGGEFISHGSQQKAKMRVIDQKFPGVKQEDFELLEEWYALKNFASNLHVILVQETEGMKVQGGDAIYKRPDYPATWARKHHKGRVVYTSLGHREDVWQSAIMQDLLVGALNWVVGNVEADVSPNMEKAAPKGTELSAK